MVKNIYSDFDSNFESEVGSDLGSVFTPEDYQVEEESKSANFPVDQSEGRLHSFFILDDVSAFDHQVDILKERGASIFSLPSLSDMDTVLPFLIKHDYSILIAKNPSKSQLNILKQLLRSSSISYKKQKISFPITIWVMVDSVLFLETKLKQPVRGPEKKISDVLAKEYSYDFIQLFDIFSDSTLYTNGDLMGSKFSKYQDSCVLDKLATAMLGPEENIKEKEGESLYNYKKFKC